MRIRRLGTATLLTLALALVPVPARAAPAAGPPAAAPAAGTPALTRTDLATRDTNGYPQYRIPALAVTGRGTLLAAYDGRPSMADLPSPITDLVRRSTDGGRTWTAQQVVRTGPAPQGFGDPSLLVDRRTGRVFLFYAASVNQGFAGSHTGNDPDDPNVLQADYSYSDDDGVTWHARRITAQIKDPAWKGMFAASGQGIQLTTGPYAGRLIQQYAVGASGGNYAVSAYSDDDGDTWHMGTPVGPGMDENKTVQLADGSVMLNVRAAPHRLVALSHDGGVTYSAPQPDPAQIDPGDNGSIIRYAPDAPASDPRAHWLLLSNTADPSVRRNLTVRMSCDDGKSWPVSRVVEPQSSAYSTLATLPGGRVGLFYERAGYQQMTYASFGLDWLGGVCAPLAVGTQPLAAGTAGSVQVTVTNQASTPLAAGTLTLDVPAGWTAGTVRVPPLPRGAHTQVDVPVTPARTAGGQVDLTAQYTVEARHSSSRATLSVTPAQDAPAAPGLSVQSTLDHLTAAGRPGVLDDVAIYWTRVRNTGNTPLTDVTVTGTLDGLPACHYSSLAAGQSYVCRSSTRTVTVDDVAAGSFAPRLTVGATAPDGSTTTASGTGERLDTATATAPGGPQTVPSLRRWSAGQGDWTADAGTRIAIDPQDAQTLAQTAATFAADLRTETGRTFPVAVGTARAGDIALSTAVDDPQLGTEGYRLDIGSTVRIAAPTTAGVFYGTQTVEQLLKADPQRASLPRGTAQDWPATGERSQMLDVGRKFFPLSYLEQQIRQMAWQKLNTFHLHFSDWEGFRIQVPQFPGLASAQSYSPADLRELQDYAARYHVTVVPEIDLPGHANAITAYDPSLRFACPSMDQATWPGGEKGGWTLDVTKPHTRQFVHDLLAAVVPMFDSKVIHVGGDEVGLDPAKNACPELVDYAKAHGFPYTEDVFVDELNAVDDQLRALGRTTEAWEWWNQYGQRSSIAPNRDIVLEDYVDSDATALAAQGYTVVSAPEPVLYVSPGFGRKLGQYGYVDLQNAYEHYAFAAAPNLAGYEVARWSDGAEDQSPAWFDFFAERPLQVLAERTWGGPLSPTVWQFLARADAVGGPPGSAGGALTAVPKAGIGIASVDSQETTAEYAAAANVLDDDPYTIWHTAYSGGIAPPPHQVTLDLHGAYRLAGLDYLPRQDGGVNGRVADYRIAVSGDGTAWTTVAAGTFADDQTAKRVAFPTVTARYVRFSATSATNGQPFTSAAELTLLQAPAPGVPGA